MNSDHEPTIGEGYISFIMKQTQKYSYAPMLNLFFAALFGVAAVLGYFKGGVPLSIFLPAMFLLLALDSYINQQFSRMILERDNKIAELLRD